MVLVNRKGILQKFLFLLEVDGLETSGNRSAGRTTGVQDVTTVMVLSGVQQGLNTGLGVRPGTGIQRFLLAPDYILGVGVAIQVFLQLSPREGMQLLNTSDGGVANAVGFAVLNKRGIYLTRAKNDTLNFLRLINGRSVTGVPDDPLEVRVIGELFKVRSSNGVTQ